MLILMIIVRPKDYPQIFTFEYLKQVLKNIIIYTILVSRQYSWIIKIIENHEKLSVLVNQENSATFVNHCSFLGITLRNVTYNTSNIYKERCPYQILVLNMVFAKLHLFKHIQKLENIDNHEYRRKRNTQKWNTFFWWTDK